MLLFYLILRLRAVISLLHDARRGYIPGIKLRKIFSLQATVVRWLGIEPSWMVLTNMDFVVFVNSTLKNISTCVSLRPCIAIVVQTGLEPARALNAPNKDVYQFHHCTPGMTGFNQSTSTTDHSRAVAFCIFEVTYFNYCPNGCQHRFLFSLINTYKLRVSLYI